MRKLILLTLWLLATASHALSQEDLLRPEQAFQASTSAKDNQLRVKWTIADGYYLYRSKLRLTSTTPGISLGNTKSPPGEIKHDDFFGDIEIYRGEVELQAPINIEGSKPGVFELEARSQGCADAGLCYPPRTERLLVTLPPDSETPPPVAASATSAAAEALNHVQGSGENELAQATPAADPVKQLGALSDALGIGGATDDILPVEQAFQLEAKVAAPDLVQLQWLVAEETYLYNDKIKISVEGDGVTLGEIKMPKPKIKENGVTPEGEIGDVAVYVGDFAVDLPLLRSKTEAQQIKVNASYQGCAERGICYPPQRKSFTLDLAALASAAPAATPAAAPETKAASVQEPAPSAAKVEEQSEQDQIAALLKTGSTLLILATFFGIGLLLAFTPCVFPMIPILSGIIAGHGHKISTKHAFWLSTIYVLAMSLTYTVAGVLAGMFGANLQAAFQNPWVLSVFAGLFVALAMSMFGFYDLQLPASWQSRLAETSNKQHGGQFTGVAIMGLLSALIVGPCVAPPLAGALIFIGQTGDALLGGLALFAMSLGMGAPLIAIGTSAGKLLPKAGPWMDTVKAVFGVAMLGLAITMLERILPPAIALLLWGLLLVISGIYMGALSPLHHESTGWHKLWKGLGLSLLIYGATFLIGSSAGGKDSLQPLRGLGLGSGASQAQAHLSFKRIKSTQDLQQELAAAKAAGKPVMLDFYADWCVYCKQMEKNTFPAPEVQAALGDFVLLQADVTDQDDADKALQQEIGIPAPPAMIFWDKQGKEHHNLRLLGFMNAQDFAQHVNKLSMP